MICLYPVQLGYVGLSWFWIMRPPGYCSFKILNVSVSYQIYSIHFIHIGLIESIQVIWNLSNLLNVFHLNYLVVLVFSSDKFI